MIRQYSTYLFWCLVSFQIFTLIKICYFRWWMYSFVTIEGISVFFFFFNEGKYLTKGTRYWLVGQLYTSPLLFPVSAAYSCSPAVNRSITMLPCGVRAQPNGSPALWCCGPLTLSAVPVLQCWTTKLHKVTNLVDLALLAIAMILYRRCHKQLENFAISKHITEL